MTLLQTDRTLAGVFHRFIFPVLALLLVVLVSGCGSSSGSASRPMGPQEGVFVSDSIKLEGGVMRGNSLDVWVGSGADRKGTVVHQISARVDPSKLKLRRFKEDKTLVLTVARRFLVKYDVSGDYMVTRRLPKSAYWDGVETITVSAATNWEGSTQAVVPDVLLGRSANVLGLEGSMVGKSIDSTVTVQSVQIAK